MRKENNMATSSLDWMLAGTAAGAVDYYLKIPTIPGEATTKGFDSPAQIAVEAYNLEIAQTLNIGSQSAGAGAGKVTFHPFQIKKHYDTASPKLFQAACTAANLGPVTFSIVKTGSGSTDGKTAPKPYLVITFNLIYVKTIIVETLGAYTMEVVSFEYGAIAFAYSTMSPSGALTAATQFGWDRTKNINWTPS
jgi:type VI secretion system Hcp family effector